MGLVRHSRQNGNLRECEIGGQHEPLGVRDTTSSNIYGGGTVERLSKRTRKSTWAQVHEVSQLLNAASRIEVLLNVRRDAPHLPTQQPSSNGPVAVK
jgi:hypothetical protein